MSIKNINKRNSVEAFWQTILLDGEIFNIAGKFREQIGMPAGGFVYEQEWEKWREGNIKKDSHWEEKRKENALAFIRSIKGKYSYYKGILEDWNFTAMLTEFYHFNNISDETLQKYLYSGFDVFVIKNNKRVLFASMGINDGVYIKINPSASIDSVTKYIKDNKSHIRWVQENFRLLENIPVKKLKIHKDFKRDDLIVFLYGLDKKELEGFEGVGRGVKGGDKENLIAIMMNERFGFKGVTTEMVRIVIQRRRKMIKATSGINNK